MKAEREFAGFVLPFATGIMFATGPALTRLTYLPALATASLAVTSLLLVSMLNPSVRREQAMLPWVMTALLGLAAGAFAGMTSLIMDISSYSTDLGLRAECWGARLGEFIDAVPFGSDKTNAMLKALITGERGDIPSSVTEAFRDSGAAHILSLSGFHLGIVYGIVRGLLAGLGNSPRVVAWRSVLTILFCGFYTLATGAGPSIVRAFLFILLGETARVMHREGSTATRLMSALFLQMVMDPSSIRSVSFQLSYAAMAGIAWIYPRLRDFWPGNSFEDRFFTRCVRWIWNSAALSIACQITTGPLAWFYFRSFPLYFMLTNLIALPLTGILIPVGLAAIVLSGLGICPEFLLQATDFLVSCLSCSLEIISDM